MREKDYVVIIGSANIDDTNSSEKTRNFSCVIGAETSAPMMT